MATKMTDAQLQKLVNDVRIQAEKDPALKALALKDVAAAVKKLTGQEIPSDIKLRLVQQGSEMVALQGGADAQLTDAQLDAVAGGAGCRCGRTNVLRLG